MKRTKNRVLLAVLAAVCLLAFFLAWIPFGKLTARAAEIDDEDFYSQANTYNATITQREENIEGINYPYDFAEYVCNYNYRIIEEEYNAN